MPDLGGLGPLIVATLIGGLVSLGGSWAARKAGLGSAQAALSVTLEKNNSALNDRVAELDRRLISETRRSAKLAARLIRIERTVVALAEENDSLRARLKMPSRKDAQLARLAQLSHETDPLELDEADDDEEEAT